MSLISLRNLVGPLRSKFQMGALAIAILLVLVIRFGITRSSERVNAELEGNPDSGELVSKVDHLNKARKSARRGAASQDRILDNLVAEGFDGAQENTRESDNNESFDDIRRSLGLD